MELKIFKEKVFRELTLDEVKSINGGKPNKTTSFFYDMS